MTRETTDSTARNAIADSRGENHTYHGDRSTDQPPRAGLKGAGRSRAEGPWSSLPALFRARSSACAEYPVERPRATGGFLPVLLDPERDAGSTGLVTPSSSRAQTSIDFVVGASVFLLTVAFVVGFLPGVFEPFTASGEGDVLAADRTASLLAEQVLADPTTPGVFDEACTAEFFDAEGDGADGVAGCRFDADAADLDAALGLGPATSVNVTIERNGTVRSIQHDGEEVHLRAGPSPPTSESVVVSHRVVLLDDGESDLFVRVW